MKEFCRFPFVQTREGDSIHMAAGLSLGDIAQSTEPTWDIATIPIDHCRILYSDAKLSWILANFIAENHGSNISKYHLRLMGLA